ncbi:glycosyltransferase involved in cell wall biosynthesis [Pseudomonas duriflava]|uniref:Glycosyltransferase involved in cell wall biosynthesis n=1 Tax=Pseudomonas duriflava TaxID=459528 RepID=A0A562QKB7_9PSED|nr:glycosyltransferase family 1 protein [Pseudomonas duriflava]TWI56486.1 glycosyltransferase involved in cell wall biosynthesis [Pseudomonas duriflava]
MRIVLDLQGAQTESRFRGIGRYSLSLALGIARNRGEHEIFILLNGQFPDAIEPIRAAFDGLIPQDNIRVWYGPAPVAECLPGNDWRRQAAEYIREAYIATLQPDVVHISSLFEGTADNAVTTISGYTKEIPTLVTLYDLIPLMNAKDYLDPHPVFKKYYLNKIESLKNAQGWLGISESASQEGVNIIGLPAERVTNISTAADSIFVPANLTAEEEFLLREKFAVQSPFVLYTGGADARKNLERMIQAYAQLPEALRSEHQLVLAGKMPTQIIAGLKAHASSLGLQEAEIVFTGYITDKELIELYSLCKTFIFPSWHEGFGLPALEAMCCGASVIGSNTSSVPEVIGCPEALFDPLDVADIKSKLHIVLTDEDFRKKLIAHGKKQSKKFSWDRSAKLALQAFEQAVKSDSVSVARGTAEIVSTLQTSIASIGDALPTYEDIKQCASALAKNFEIKVSKRLFIDISQLVHIDSKSGIQRVVRSILKELLESPPEGFISEPVYATMDSLGYRYAREFIAKYFPEHANTEEIKDSAIEYSNGDIFLGLDLQHHVVIRQQAAHQAMRNAGVKVFFVVYDLLPVLMPEVFRDFIGDLHKDWLAAISRNDGLLCISQAVADDMRHWLEKNPVERYCPLHIDWFHLGADVENSIPTKGLPDDAAEVLAKLKECPTFLSVGTIEPRKGHDQTLKAFDLLWQEGVEANLVLVGQAGWNVDELIHDITHHKLLGKRLFWLKGISDEYLEKIYQNATCLVFSSKGEGFGLPLIEAAQFGLPIIARDIPVFREIAEANAHYFKGSKAEDLSKEVKAWLDLRKSGLHPSSSNMKWLTWKQSAEQIKARLTATA